ncbi:(2Fe-2S) ferredoxin domain-containing protein [Leptolyngbya sp. FACHB-261]|uniref:(2Fe-2S) ferredoxin domain-containing protein n=1 Tax=Leptolyngbya sp. FACHB-261 TaxID=2692806 RepID=UPI0016831DFF|nr:(2Fe-2S) ferredoxin domain-containing protein [Leptolyngbya sp. FACHB-261]
MPSASNSQAPAPTGLQATFYVCHNRTCRRDGSPAVYDALQRILQDLDLRACVDVVPTGCMGNCGCGPVVAVAPVDRRYRYVQPKHALELVQRHCPTACAVSC